jgi:GNAT superfamily N-acetyltransferase
MRRVERDDRLRSAMFESGNRVRFLAEVGPEDRQWWLSSIYDLFGLTPEDVGDRLSSSWAGDKRMEVTELNGLLHRFAISISGEFASGQVWLLDRTLDFQGSFLNADRMFIDPDRQQEGTGRRFMADAVALATELGLKEIRLEADNIGKYVWLRCGFLPDRGSWTSMKPFVIQRIVEAREDVGAQRFSELLAMADSPDPVAARELAAVRDGVRSRYPLEFGRTLEVPLGRAIFIEAAPAWSGSIALDDPVSMTVLRNYVGQQDDSET